MATNAASTDTDTAAAAAATTTNASITTALIFCHREPSFPNNLSKQLQCYHLHTVQFTMPQCTVH